MDILIFGATGKTGEQLLTQALPEHRVTAFVRNTSEFAVKHGNLKVARGDVKDYAAIQDALQVQHCVLVVLGAKSPFKRDPVLVEGIRNIVRAMESKGTKRIIYLSFAGVKDSQKQLGLFRFIAASLLSNVVKDHEGKEKIIRASSLEWTIVRPALLSNGVHTGKFKSGEELKPKLSDLMISRADVADFMLRQLTGNAYLKRAPLLSH